MQKTKNSTFIIVCLLGILFFMCFGTRANTADNTNIVCKGTVSNITMNEKHFKNIENQTFTLSKKQTNTGVITGSIGKIGKMPGTLHFSIPVTINKDGTLHAKENTEVGKLKFSFGGSKKLLCKSMSGTCKNGTLKFTLRVTSTMLGIKMADASFSFNNV